MGKCKFNPEWLKCQQYKSWLKPGKNPDSAYCTVCHTEFQIGRMGKSALTSHMKGSRHGKSITAVTSNGNSVTSYFEKQGSSNVSTTPPGGPTVSAPAPATGDTPSRIPVKATRCDGTRDGTLDSFVKKEDVLRAEVLWALKVVNSHYSYSSCNNANALFSAMFPDSKIAQKFTCSERKCAYIACFGIAPYLKAQLKRKLGDNPYVLLFDESLNKMTQSKQLDVHIRTWNSDIVSSEYYGSSFLGHATANDMLESFRKDFSDLSFKNLFQLSMDGPNVNWKFYEMLQEDIVREFDVDSDKQLLNIGSCGLHIIHNAFRTGVTAASWNTHTESLLSSLYYLFKDSPARRDDYATINKTDRFPLKFCYHRWLENVPCVERALECWPDIKQYVSHMQKKKKSEQPTCKSYAVVKEAVSDHVVIAKLNTFLSIAKQVTPFLTQYQTDIPMVPFLASDMQSLLRALMKRFIKSDILQAADSVYKLIRVDVKKQQNYLEPYKIDMGFSAERKLKELLVSKKISDRDVMTFRMETRAFLVEMVSRIVSKAPVKYLIVRNMQCLDPVFLSKNPDASATKLKNILKILVDSRHVREDDCDDILNQFRDFLDFTVTRSKSEFQSFNYKVDRVDRFFYDHLHSNGQYSKLWKVISSLLLLSHGQATVERGFSVNRQIEVENLAEHSYESQRLICEFLRKFESVHMVPITNDLLKYVSSAHSQYQSYLSRKKKEEEKIQKGEKRKQEEEAMKELRTKKRLLETDIRSLSESADGFAEAAEKCTKHAEAHTLISKSVSFRKSAKQKKIDLNNVELALREKEELLKSLL